MKRIICCLLVLVMILGLLSGCSRETVEPEIPSPEEPEIIKARELGLIPAEWEGNLAAEADFAGFNQLITSFIKICDESALAVWKENVDETAFPQSGMHRDDALILLLLSAEALGYNYYNAREYAFCTEYIVDYNEIYSQLSGNYPYCDAYRKIPIYFDAGKEYKDPCGPLLLASVYWMQRRMDLSRHQHFLDCDDNLDFHLDQPLTREDAVAAVLRLYNSEMLGYDPLAIEMREQTDEDVAILTAAEEMKARILDNGEELPCHGTAYFVSARGDDANDGKTPETAWASLDRVNRAELACGDSIRFERGGVWRGQLWAQEGVSYSAYGEGEKPKLYASPENGAATEKWTLLEGTDNIWVYHRDMMDCGVIVFNEGESWGVKVSPRYMDGYLSTIDDDQPFDVRTELTEDLMFFSEADSILYEGAPFRYSVMDWCDKGEYPENVEGELYLRCDVGNPGEVFDSIEFAVRQNLVIPADGAVFHNLCLKYTGAHCIYSGDICYDVSFCEIGWIGGTIQYYRYDDGEPVRFGNGVENDGSYDHYSVTDCCIYQCFDAGVSNQDPSEDPAVTGNYDAEYRDMIQKNITYARNVFAYNDMPIEIFFTLEDDTGYGRHYMENVLIEDNYFLYTGYGWAGRQDNKAQDSAAYMGHEAPNAAKNFRIANNVFYLSTGPLIMTGAPEKWMPELDANTYVQNDGGVFVCLPGEEGYSVSYAFYYNDNRDTVTELIRGRLGDMNARVLKN